MKSCSASSPEEDNVLLNAEIENTIMTTIQNEPTTTTTMMSSEENVASDIENESTMSSSSSSSSSEEQSMLFCGSFSGSQIIKMAEAQNSLQSPQQHGQTTATLASSSRVSLPPHHPKIYSHQTGNDGHVMLETNEHSSLGSCPFLNETDHTKEDDNMSHVTSSIVNQQQLGDQQSQRSQPEEGMDTSFHGHNPPSNQDDHEREDGLSSLQQQGCIYATSRTLENIHNNRFASAMDFDFKSDKAINEAASKPRLLRSSSNHSNQLHGVTHSNNSQSIVTLAEVEHCPNDCTVVSHSSSSPTEDETSISSYCHSDESYDSDSRSHLLLRAIYNAQLSAAIHIENPSRLFLDLLNEVLCLLRCGYGFIGELKLDEYGKPFLHSHALSFAKTKLTDEARDLFNRVSSCNFKFNNMNTLFGHVLMTGEAIVTNDPKNHPKRSPTHLPKGHPRMDSFLGIPLHFNNELVGMIGLANKEGGFHNEDVTFLEPLCTTCSSIIVAWRYYLDREEAREKLRLSNLNLEHKIFQRTQELLQSNSKLSEEVERRRKIEQELLEQQKISQRVMLEKENFLRNVSHDCRTPLNAILGFSDLLLRSVDEFPISNQQLEFINLIKTSGESMLSLINDFLEIMKLEQQMKLNNELFSPCEPFEEVLDLVVLECDKKKLDLIIDYHPDFNFSTILYTDKGKMKQVLLNLLSNAVKFTTFGYIYIRVKMVTHQDGFTEMEVCVKDTGIGIEKENLSKIGQPFVQFKTKQESKGTGLGVSISKMIAQGLGGNLKVDSQGIGCGSEFTFTCKVPYKTFKDLTTEEQQAIHQREMVKFESLNEILQRDVTYFMETEQCNEFKILILDRSNLFADSLSHMIDNIDTVVRKIIFVCDSKKTLKTEIQNQIQSCGEFCKIIIFVDAMLLFDESISERSLSDIYAALDIPIELSLQHHNTSLQEPTRQPCVRIIPMLQQSIFYGTSVIPLSEYALMKPIFKVEDIAKILFPSIFVSLGNAYQSRKQSLSDADESLLSTAASFSVLVVDDNAINAKVISHMLFKLGIRNVTTCTSGEEAIEYVKKKYYNLIFLDLLMDGLNGTETSRIINMTCRHNAPCIILLTANLISEREREELINNNVKHFMTKPVRFTDVRQKIIHILRSQLNALTQ
nr:unnamed protein product [Naegleria fowleri]